MPLIYFSPWTLLCILAKEFYTISQAHSPRKMMKIDIGRYTAIFHQNFTVVTANKNTVPFEIHEV